MINFLTLTLLIGILLSNYVAFVLKPVISGIFYQHFNLVLDFVNQYNTVIYLIRISFRLSEIDFLIYLEQLFDPISLSII